MAFNELSGGVVTNDGFWCSAPSDLFQKLVDDLALAGSRITKQ